MNGWSRLGGVLLTVGLAAGASGCGQLFTSSSGSPTLSQLSSRVDSMDAQLGELQAALANMGQGTTASASGTAPGATGATAAAGSTSSGVVQSDLPVAVVEADVLNVRDDPSLTGTVKGTLLQNAQVNVLANQGNWSEIRFSNPASKVTLTGWVDSDYLGPVQNAAATAAGTSAAPASSGAAAASSQSSAY